MDSSASPLLVQGLIISTIALALVFGALALLWGLTRLLTNILADKVAATPEVSMELEEADLADAQAAIEAAADLTEERARVAAIVAGALLSSAVPVVFHPPTGPAFEHGRVAPSWVTGNRARTLRPWERARIPETNHRSNE